MNPGGIPFQLDELAFAEGSPIGGTVEHQKSALRTEDTFQRLLFAVLIHG